MEQAPGADASSRRPLLIVVGIALVLGLLELPVASFMADDFIQLSALEGVSPDTWTGPLELHSITDGDPEHVLILKNAGAFAWFFDPEFKMAFFRPLSSGLLALDHAIFGLSPVGFRAHGVLWFLLLVVGLGGLLRRVLPTRLAFLALLLFTISGVQANLYWTATRHICVAAALGVLGLLCHVRWRQEGWRPGRALSVLAFALSLCASEAAIAVLAYLLAYEVLGAKGTWRERHAALLPVGVLVIGYLCLFQLLDLGVSGGSGYMDPFRHPLQFLLHFPGRLLALAGGMFFGGHVDLWVLRPDLRGLLVGAGAVATALAVVLLRTAWRHVPPEHARAVRWLAVGALLAAVPFAGSAIGARCLIVPMIGGSAVIALVIYAWWTSLRKTPGLRYRLAGALCIFLALIHLVVAPLQRLAGPSMFREMMNRSVARAMEQAELDVDRLPQQRVVVLWGPGIAVGLHSFYYRILYRMPMPRSWRTLSWAPFDHRFLRTADDAMEMEVVDGVLEAPHLRRGQVIELEGMRATVLELGSTGPTRVEFKFDMSLDDPSLHFLGWREGRLRHVVMPAVGESVELRRGG